MHSKPIIWLCLGIIFIVLGGCSTLTQVPEPKSDQDTLLIIPVQVKNETEFTINANLFFYHFILKHRDTEERIKIGPYKKFEVIHGLKPGIYHIVKLEVGKTSSEYPLTNMQVELKPGKVVMFPVRLDVKFIYKDGMIYQGVEFTEIDLKLKREIVKSLKGYRNFDRWSVDY